MNELISQVSKYIKYLRVNCGLDVSIHFSQDILSGFPEEAVKNLLVYNTHDNPYCILVKAMDNGFRKCVFCQKRIIKKCESEKEFSGTCHAGVYEYVYGLYSDGRAIGFISVSGYREMEYEKKNLYTKGWKEYLKSEEIPIEICRTLIPPLCRMIELLFKYLPKEFTQGSEYNLMLQYVNEHHNKIELEDLCQIFHRSQSYVSHIFKKKTGVTLKTYCNRLKIEDAKKLLSMTDFQITEVAFAAGFNDVSYFISVFRRFTGSTPFQWRKLKK